MQTFSNYSDLINAYLTGAVNDGSFGSAHFSGSDFFYGKYNFAKRTPAEVFLGHSANVGEEINDGFLSALFAKGIKFARVGNIDSLLNSSAILSALGGGDRSKLDGAAAAFNLTFNEEDVKTYLSYNELIRKHAAELDALSIPYGNAHDGITKVVQDEVRRRREAARAVELAQLEAKKAQYTADFDEGKPLTGEMQRNVKGADGEGLRIRTISSRADRVEVQSTTGERTTLRIIREAFNKAAPLVFGPKENRTSIIESNMNGYYGHHVGEVRDYSVKVFKDKVSIGCQTVSYDELKRFATLQGWPLDGSAATE